MLPFLSAFKDALPISVNSEPLTAKWMPVPSGMVIIRPSKGI
jgi:hypothetical protein